MTGNVPSIFSSNSEADASEILETIEEVFLLYNMESNAIRRFQFSITHWCVTRRERVTQHSAVRTASQHYTYITEGPILQDFLEKLNECFRIL